MQRKILNQRLRKVTLVAEVLQLRELQSSFVIPMRGNIGLAQGRNILGGPGSKRHCFLKLSNGVVHHFPRQLGLA